MKKLLSAFAASTLALTMATTALAFPAPSASEIARACAGMTGVGRSRCNHNIQAKDMVKKEMKKIVRAMTRISPRTIREGERARQRVERSSSSASMSSASTSSTSSAH